MIHERGAGPRLWLKPFDGARAYGADRWRASSKPDHQSGWLVLGDDQWVMWIPPVPTTTWRAIETALGQTPDNTGGADGGRRPQTCTTGGVDSCPRPVWDGRHWMVCGHDLVDGQCMTHGAVLASAEPPAGALPEHLRGDGPCMDCGTPDNVRWFTDNVFWNRVMGGPGTRDDPGGIVCIPCFVARADAAGFHVRAWRVLPEFHWETDAERATRIGGSR